MTKLCTNESPSTLSIRVLTVMPTNEDHETLGSMLAPPKWAVHQTRTVSSAVAQLNKKIETPIVLCEKELWPGSWRDILYQIHNMSAPPNLIVTSRTADEQLWAEALNLGAYDVLAKPFEVSELERSLTLAWIRWCRARGRGPKESGM